MSNSTLSTYNETRTGTLFVIYGKVSAAGSYLGEPAKQAVPIQVTFKMRGVQYQGQHTRKYWKVVGEAYAAIEGQEYIVDYSYDGQDRHPSNAHDALLKISGSLSRASGQDIMMSDPANYDHASWRWF
jgi:hypothetical protein